MKELQQLIEQLRGIEDKPVISGSQSDFFAFFVEFWEEGKIAFEGQNTFGRLVKFIGRCFRIRKEDGTAGFLKTTSISTMLYKFLKKK